mmetsp:Transcript_13508/g.33167  ORF Transcript_13508/g.33167 Transcript_13508/m.33167 type:complete len:352 (+) Transcript_13508:3085-4140(+)
MRCCRSTTTTTRNSPNIQHRAGCGSGVQTRDVCVFRLGRRFRDDDVKHEDAAGLGERDQVLLRVRAERGLDRLAGKGDNRRLGVAVLVQHVRTAKLARGGRNDPHRVAVTAVVQKENLALPRPRGDDRLRRVPEPAAGSDELGRVALQETPPLRLHRLVQPPHLPKLQMLFPVAEETHRVTRLVHQKLVVIRQEHDLLHQVANALREHLDWLCRFICSGTTQSPQRPRHLLVVAEGNEQCGGEKLQLDDVALVKLQTAGGAARNKGRRIGSPTTANRVEQDDVTLQGTTALAGGGNYCFLPESPELHCSPPRPRPGLQRLRQLFFRFLPAEADAQNLGSSPEKPLRRVGVR